MLLLLWIAGLGAAAQQPPVINDAGVVVNGQGARHVLRPGDEISIYGRNLGQGSPCQAPGGRFTQVTDLCGSSVRVADQAAFVISAQEQQLNVRLPYDLPTEGRLPVVVTYRGVASVPQMVPASPYEAVVRLRGRVMSGMPVWVDLSLPNPPVHRLRYPLRIDPVDLGGHMLELRREGVLLTPRQPGPESAAYVGLSTVGTVGTGGFLGLAHEPRDQNRLPLHLLYPQMQPGRYEVRYVGYSPPRGRRKPQVLVRSPWVAFTVTAATPAARRDWINQLPAAPPSDPVEWLSDYLPSLLATPDAAILPAMAQALYHPDHLVRRYTVAALRLFEDALIAGWLPQLLREQGATPELAYALPGHAAFRGREAELLDTVLPHLKSSRMLAVSGTLQTIYLLHVHLKRFGRAVPEPAYQQVAAAAGGLIATHNRDVLPPLALCLGTWKSENSRVLLLRLVEEGSVKEQAEIALRWTGQK